MYLNKSILDLIVLTVLALLLHLSASLFLGIAIGLTYLNVFFIVLIVGLPYWFYVINEKWLRNVQTAQTNVEKKRKYRSKHTHDNPPLKQIISCQQYLLLSFFTS